MRAPVPGHPAPTIVGLSASRAPAASLPGTATYALTEGPSRRRRYGQIDFNSAASLAPALVSCRFFTGSMRGS